MPVALGGLGLQHRNKVPYRRSPTKQFQLRCPECWPKRSVKGRTLRCHRPARRTHRRAAASLSCRRPQDYSRRPGSSSSPSSFSSQGSRTSTSASLHSAFIGMAGFIFICSVQPLLLLLINRDSMRTLGFCKVSARAFSHQSILRSTARFPSRGQNPSNMPHVRGRLPQAVGPSLNGLSGRGVKRRHGIWALV